jgi:hypothetical protein
MTNESEDEKYTAETIVYTVENLQSRKCTKTLCLRFLLEVLITE